MLVIWYCFNCNASLGMEPNEYLYPSLQASLAYKERVLDIAENLRGYAGNFGLYTCNMMEALFGRDFLHMYSVMGRHGTAALPREGREALEGSS